MYAGVELGGTKCVVILASGPDEVLAREIIATTSPDETLGRIEQRLADWKQHHGFDALGIASFGPIDLDPGSQSCGHTLTTTKLGWSNANIAPRLRDATGVPTAFDTDVNGAAFAEMRWGSGRGFEDFAYVTVGTGVGVGLIVNGRPTRGFGHCELGHIRAPHPPGDEWAGACPYHGDCIEGLASGSALKARFGTELDSAHPAWDSVAFTLAELCNAIVCTAAPRRIAIGGGVIEARPQLVPLIRARLVERVNGYLQLPPGDYVCAPQLGRDAGPLGAIALAMTA